MKAVLKFTNSATSCWLRAGKIEVVVSVTDLHGFIDVTVNKIDSGIRITGRLRVYGGKDTVDGLPRHLPFYQPAREFRAGAMGADVFADWLEENSDAWDKSWMVNADAVLAVLRSPEFNGTRRVA